MESWTHVQADLWAVLLKCQNTDTTQAQTEVCDTICITLPVFIAICDNNGLNPVKPIITHSCSAQYLRRWCIWTACYRCPWTCFSINSICRFFTNQPP